MDEDLKFLRDNVHLLKDSKSLGLGRIIEYTNSLADDAFKTFHEALVEGVSLADVDHEMEEVRLACCEILPVEVLQSEAKRLPKSEGVGETQWQKVQGGSKRTH